MPVATWTQRPSLAFLSYRCHGADFLVQGIGRQVRPVGPTDGAKLIDRNLTEEGDVAERSNIGPNSRSFREAAPGVPWSKATSNW